MFHLSLQKDRNIPTLYEKVHNFLGYPVNLYFFLIDFEIECTSNRQTF